jgi:hypothetical protein
MLRERKSKSGKINNLMRIRLQFVIAGTLVTLCLPGLAASVLWRQTLDGGAPDEGMSVKADAAGNVYVAAMTYLPPNAWLLLVKLNETGAEQWRTNIPVATAGAPQSGSCRIVLVGNDTYVACHEGAADHGAFIAHCRADGSVAWREDCAEITWPQALVTDGNSVYLAGTNSEGELALKKFDQSGPAWTLSITNASISGRDIGGHINVTSNDVFVTGSQLTDEIALGTTRVKAAFVLRCSTDGDVLWRRTLVSTNRLNTLGFAVAQLSDGSVVMGGSQLRYATNLLVAEFGTNLFVRFDADGNELLRTSLSGTEFPELIVPLASGDMLMVAPGGGRFDLRRNAIVPIRMRVSKVSADGVVQWVRAHGPRSGSSEVGAVRFEPNGRLLLGGYDYSIWRGPTKLFLTEANADTGRLRNRTFAIPRVSRTGRYDFEIDTRGNFYFLGGDGTSWPNVILTKFRGLPQ